MPTNSANWRMADRLAGGRLDADLAELAAQGASLRHICAVLTERYVIEITPPTARAWIANLEPTEKAS